MKHLIQGRNAVEYKTILDAIHQTTPTRFFIRNYLLNQHQEGTYEQLEVALKDYSAETAENIRWALGTGIQDRLTLIIQQRISVQNDHMSNELFIKSKVKPMGPAVQERKMAIGEDIKTLLLSIYQHQQQEKVVDRYDLASGQIVIEQQPNSVLSIEFTGGACRELMLQFMTTKPGLLDFKRPFGTQFREFQSQMGISPAEQKALNSLTFQQAAIYNNYQTTSNFIDRLNYMARAVLAEFSCLFTT